VPQLKPFQQEGAAFLAARTRALLADEPGVGKTGQLITAANMVGARSLGVVCPSIGTRHWEREANKWNYQGDRLDVIAWDVAHEVAKALPGPDKVPMQWDVLIPDEVHFGKNPNARRTRAVFAPGGLAWYGRRLWPASGTPAPNNASELYPMMKALGKTKMDAETFKTYYCIVDPVSGKVRGNRPEKVEELRAILKSFALRRLKRDVLPELGAIDIQDWYVKPDSRFVRGLGWNGAIAVHENAQLEAELRGKSAEEILIFLAGDQDFSTLRRYNALLKAPAVFETVKFEIETGLVDKIVIYGYHKEALAALDRAFRQTGIACALVYGDTPQDQRDDIIEEWKKSGQVLLASMMVASTVLDFTCAHQGIALEMDWVPANNWQAWQRMHRHGQENPVTIRVAHGTPIDEIINGVVVRKTKQLAEIFD
jgi:SWI/SNF-related matrix-associated actin-dependent regulator 1 of chromatin subfamily A